MWTTVLVMAMVVSLEPVRIGLTVLMLNRPRPALQLLAFLCGGFAMGMGVGLIVLFSLRDVLSGASQLTVPRVQIVVGILALLAAGVLTTNISAGMVKRGRPAGVALGEDAGGFTTPPPLRSLSTRARGNLLNGRSLWVAGVAGSGIALPSVDYLAALAVILASDAPPATQAAALLAFNVVAFTLVELPLIGYLLAPEKTRRWMSALRDWVRSRRRRHVATLLAAAGCLLLVIGTIGL